MSTSLQFLSSRLRPASLLDCSQSVRSRPLLIPPSHQAHSPQLDLLHPQVPFESVKVLTHHLVIVLVILAIEHPPTLVDSQVRLSDHRTNSIQQGIQVGMVLPETGVS